MSSELGQAILEAGKAAGRADAAARLSNAIAEVGLPGETLRELQSFISAFTAAHTSGLELPSVAQPAIDELQLSSKTDLSTAISAPDLSTFVSAVKMSRTSVLNNVSETLVHDRDVQARVLCGIATSHGIIPACLVWL